MSAWIPWQARAMLVALMMTGCAQAQTAKQDQPAHSAAQRMVLDEQTGQPVTDPSAGDASGAETRATNARDPSAAAGEQPGAMSQQTRENSPYTAWTTKEGVHMLAVDPAASPHMEVRRCDDGRLISAERGADGCAEAEASGHDH